MPTNSYMITNRKYPTATSYDKIVPLTDATMWWYMSTAGPYDPNPSNYEPQSSTPWPAPPSSFQGALIDQLKAQANPNLTIFIHGLGNVWSDAVVEVASLGRRLEQYGPYAGLVIGFSWPSYGEFESGLEYASSYPPAKTSGTIRDNINGSVQSFGNLVSWTQNLAAAVQGLSVNVACHSEGNYMLMLGLAPISSIQLGQVVLLAADVNNGAFQTPAGGLIGQGAKIAALSSRTTVYYSTNDSVLADSEGAYGLFHNPSYAGRLGQTGPAYNQGTQQSKSVGVDCSGVVNTTYVAPLVKKGIVPPDEPLHSTYMYIPQVLQDITQTLVGTSSNQVVNRKATANPNAYFMNPVPTEDAGNP